MFNWCCFSNLVGKLNRIWSNEIKIKKKENPNDWMRIHSEMWKFGKMNMKSSTIVHWIPVTQINWIFSFSFVIDSNRLFSGHPLQTSTPHSRWKYVTGKSNIRYYSHWKDANIGGQKFLYKNEDVLYGCLLYHILNYL